MHDWLCGYRGGEAVLERFADIVTSHASCAGLWVMVDDGKPVSPSIDALPTRTSALQDIPFAATRLRRHLLPLYPRAVADISLQIRDEHDREPIDLVLSSSSAAVKGVAAPPGVDHICYCHTPPRYLWSQGGQYASQGLISRVGLAICGPALRAWDAGSAGDVTRFLANSAHTAGEIRARYGRESTVLHPPCRTEYFHPDASVVREDFWLVAGALEPYKRTDLAIQAAAVAGARIVIAGSGSGYSSLRRRFESPSVRFLGRVSDEELRDLYRRARLLVFPQIEDFGIVAVEAQACGLPVVARRAGGALDSVVEDLTGAFFDEATPASIAAAAARVPQVSALACRQNALRFSESGFDRAMMGILSGWIGERS